MIPDCEKCGSTCAIHDLGVRGLKPKHCASFKPLSRDQILNWDAIDEQLASVRRLVQDRVNELKLTEERTDKGVKD